MESPLPLKTTPNFPVTSPNTPNQYDHRAVERTHCQAADICFRCRQAGHWSRSCPINNNNKSRLHVAQNSNFPYIYCRCGHGFCEVRTAKSDQNCGRSYYVCPIKRGKKCRDFIKWCDDPIDESDLRPPLYKYPTCSCRAGVCRRVKATSGSNKGRDFFACPIRQGHGACSYLVWEDTLLVIPNIEDLMDTDITPDFGDLRVMDMDMGITTNIDDLQGQATNILDVDDSQDIDETVSGSWESLVENARSILHQLKTSTIHDLSPERHIQQHHEEEKVSLANTTIPDTYVKPEDSYVKAEAEFESSQQRCRSLRGEASRLKLMQQKIEGEIISCEREIKEMETCQGEIQASMIEG